MSNYFDTHCHLNLEPLYKDYDKYMSECIKNNVFVNIVAADIDSSIKAIEIKKKYPNNCIISIGIHPGDIYKNKWEELKKIIDNNINIISAIGETGLDYHYKDYDKDLQKKYFINHIELAIKTKLPLVIHCWNAYEDLYEILKTYKNKLNKILIHCYDSTKEWIKKFDELNCYYAFGGKITFPNSEYLIESLKACKENKILTETDSPWLTPFKIKENNTPVNVIKVVDFINKTLGKNLTEQIYKNCKLFFNI